MTVVLDKLTEVQTTVVETFESVKEPVTNTVTTVIDFVVERFPEIPVLPYADQFPTPSELIDNQYKFAKSLLDSNKDIFLGAAKAATPLTDPLLDRQAKAAKKATSATSATKKAASAA
jgi:hypothetical protein